MQVMSKHKPKFHREVNSMKKGLTIIVVTVFALTFCSVAMAKKRNLKYGLTPPPTHPHAKSAQLFADYVKEKTNGEITIDVFPMGQLGGERSMVEQVQGGTLDMADITTAVLSNFVPATGVFDMPFIWPSREVAYKVLADPEFKKIIFDAFPAKGFMAIGYGENEFRDLTNTRREVRTPEDLKGLKVRVMEAPVYLETWRTLGASPVPMPFPEVYGALQQGVIDGQENPLLTSIMMKFTEVCPYATVLNYSLAEAIKFVNIDLWQELTPAEQQIFYEAAELAIKANREGSKELIGKYVSDLEAGGKVKVTTLTPEERNAFFMAVQPVYKNFEKNLGTIPKKDEYGKYGGQTYLSMTLDKIKQLQ